MSIHNNKALEDVSKFSYLIAHFTGTALETIESCLISQENYVKAIDLMEKRFGRKETLINTHESAVINSSTYEFQLCEKFLADVG